MAKMIMCLLQAKGTKGQFQVALNLYRAIGTLEPPLMQSRQKETSYTNGMAIQAIFTTFDRFWGLN